MTPDLSTIQADGMLYRVGRAPDAWTWPDWNYAVVDGTFGGRYDDPGGEYRVLYASSQRIGAFVETMARFRPDPAVIAGFAEIDVDEEDDELYPTIAPGVVPRTWVERRCVGIAMSSGVFADVGHSDSVAHLRAALASRLVEFGLSDLDAGDLRCREPRRLTQLVSRYIFERDGERPEARMSGIHYRSRLGDEIDNWAVFEGREAADAVSEPITSDDADLLAAISKLGLELADEAGGRRATVSAPSSAQSIGRRSTKVPPITRLEVNGYVTSDHEWLDRAGHIMALPDRLPAAYLVTLYPSFDAAMNAGARRADITARTVFPNSLERAQSVWQDIVTRVRFVRVSGLRGRDYRDAGWALDEFVADLRSGRGHEPVWQEIKRQLLEEHVQGLLLPGPTPLGILFVSAEVNLQVSRPLAA